MENKGDKLIFLISQPRSGSTLTQRILGYHSEIYTRSEPWLMLHPAYSLKESGIHTEYDFKLQKKALNDFIDGLPTNGYEFYLEQLRRMYIALYDEYLNVSKKRYFLDKTPRYYFIYNELMQIFPAAKCILLLRNPLAVLGSIIDTWIGTQWHLLPKHKHDLTTALERLLALLQQNHSNRIVIRYENLVRDPQIEIKALCGFLGVTYENEMLTQYQNSCDSPWPFGDQNNAFNKRTIDIPEGKWKDRLREPQYWRLMHDYLQHVGHGGMQQLGYDFKEYQQTLASVFTKQEQAAIRRETIPLSTLIAQKRENAVGHYDFSLEKDAILRDTQRRIDRKNHQVAQQGKQIKQIRETVIERNRELEQLRQAVNERQEQIVEKNRRLTEQQKRLDLVNQQLIMYKDAVEDRQRRIDELRQETQQRISELREQKSINRNIDENLREKEILLKKQSLRITELEELESSVQKICKISTIQKPVSKYRAYKHILSVYTKTVHQPPY